MTTNLQNKEKFIKLLTDTNREGMDKVLSKLEEIGFYEAPASSKYHGSYDGGLLDHSLNVYLQMMYLRKVETKINPDLVIELRDDSCTIVSLLHDVCKSNFYKKCKKWRKNEQDKWEQYDTYEQDYSYLPIGHGEKSVVMLLTNGLKLTEQEIIAIRWHMGGFDVSQYGDAQRGFNESTSKNALLATLVSSDWLASKLMERK